MLINYNSFYLRKITKRKTEIIAAKDNFNIIKLIRFLEKQYGEKFINLVFDINKNKFKSLILVNGVNINDLSFKLNDKDRINILAPVTGG